MLEKIVAKFGGTSLKTAEAINRVKDIAAQKLIPLLSKHNGYIIIVVSAAGGVTNKLVEFCSKTNPQERTEILNEIKNIHFEIAANLDILNELESQILDIINRLHSYINLKISPDIADKILSIGEDLSAANLTCFLNYCGMRASFIDARNFMITDSNFGKATPDFSAISSKINPILKDVKSILLVTQGFVGADNSGNTTTLGRGGSDYSASLVAEAVKADRLFIYTDVAGVYTMDPNIVKNAKPILNLGFQEMAEMANFGAKILHPATLEPCVRSKIGVKILSTFVPDLPGTTIALEANQNNSTNVNAITLRKKQILVTIRSLKMLNAYGFLANIFAILAKYKISVDLITTSEVSVALTIDGNMLGSQEINPFVSNKNLVEELENFAEITVEEGLTLVALIGTGLTFAGAIQKMLYKLQSNLVRLICYGASSSCIGILVKSDEAENIARILHKELLES